MTPPTPKALPASQRRAHHAQRWRWPLVGMLLPTIPAFYAELLEAAPAHWSNAVYFVAAVATAALGPASSTSNAALVLRLVVAFMTLARMVQALRHWVTRGGVVYLMAAACGVLLLCGAGFWWLEPRTPTLSDGLWLAFTTAATVGYGDVVPSTPASRIFSVFVVLLGYGVLTLATAAIATTWIETEERRIEREILGDLRRQVHSLHTEIAAMRAEMRQHLSRPPET